MENWIGAVKGSLPDTVKHFAIFWNPKQFVVSGNIVEIGTLLIGKEQIWFPNGIQHRWIQVQGIIRVLAICQTWIIPLLSQKNVHSVILQKCHGKVLSPILEHEVHLHFPSLFSLIWFSVGVYLRVKQAVYTLVKNKPLHSMRSGNKVKNKQTTTQPNQVDLVELFTFELLILGENNINSNCFCYRKR